MLSYNISSHVHSQHHLLVVPPCEATCASQQHTWWAWKSSEAEARMLPVPHSHFQTVHQFSYGPIHEPIKEPQLHIHPGERGPPWCGSGGRALGEEGYSSGSAAPALWGDSLAANVTSHFGSSNPALVVLKGGTALADWYCFNQEDPKHSFPSTYSHFFSFFKKKKLGKIYYVIYQSISLDFSALLIPKSNPTWE